MEYEFEVIQGGITVAMGGPGDLDTIRRECLHYALMYAQDGPVLARIFDPETGETIGI